MDEQKHSMMDADFITYIQQGLVVGGTNNYKQNEKNQHDREIIKTTVEQTHENTSFCNLSTYYVDGWVGVWADV